MIYLELDELLAVLATLQFLNTNGLDLDLAPAEEVHSTIVQVAAENIAHEDIADWIRVRMVPLEGVERRSSMQIS